jgi:hypothetical protein
MFIAKYCELQPSLMVKRCMTILELIDNTSK